MCAGHIRFAEETAVMNVINQSEWTESGSFLTHFHPVAEVNLSSRVTSLFSVESLANLQNILLQLWADEAKYTYKYRRSMGESRSFCLCHHLHSCLQAVVFMQSFTLHMIM